MRRPAVPRTPLRTAPMPSAIYARQSLDVTKSGAAVERQLMECRSWAVAHDISVVEEYIDNDVSATTGPRPAFNRLVAAIEAGKIDAIIVWHTDRLYRRVRDLVDLVDLAESRSLSIMSVRSGTLDLTTPSGRMLAGMLGHAARFEVEQRSIRQSAAIKQLAVKGVMRGNKRLYGYNTSGRVSTVVESEAVIVREMYAMFLSGITANRIATILNRRGVVTSTGGPWGQRGVVTILGNPTFCGFSSYHGDIVGTGLWTPIISVQDYDKYVEIRLLRPARRLLQSNSTHFLTGVAICGVCGGEVGCRKAVTTNKGVTTSYLYYRCLKDRKHIARSVAPVNRHISAAIIDRLSSGAVTIVSYSSALMRSEYAEVQFLRERRRDLATALAEGLFPLDAIRPKVLEMDERIHTLSLHISDQIAGDLILSILEEDDIARHWNTMLTPADKHRVAIALLTVTLGRPGRVGRVYDANFATISWRHPARNEL